MSEFGTQFPLISLFDLINTALVSAQLYVPTASSSAASYREGEGVSGKVFKKGGSDKQEPGEC